MSDLNQNIKYIKKGVKISKDHIQQFIEKYNTANSWPICCFYIGTYGDEILQEYVNEEYISLDSYKAYANIGEEVIGCSRGCIKLEDWKKNNKLYLEKLCKGCIEEAKNLLENLDE